MKAETGAPSNTFGAWLEQTLKDKRMTISEFSERAKVSRGTLYHYIAGRRVPDPFSLGRIAGALRLTVEDMPTVVPKKNGRPPLPKEKQE